MNQSLIYFASLLILLSAVCQAKTQSPPPLESTSLITTETDDWKPGKNRVTFESEGVELVGDLYLPQDYQEGDQRPGVVVGGSWTTVKEQMAGLYAQKLADRGYVTLAFDHRYYGESGGEPRFLEDPNAKTEDFKNAMAYLSSLPMIDSDRTGGMGVCASGGYMAKAVAQDGQYQAFAAVVPWFNTEEVVEGFYGGQEGIDERLTKSREAKKTYEETGEMPYAKTVSDTDSSAAMYGPMEYYLNEDLGNVPNWSDDQFALASWEPWLTYRPVSTASEISTPTLIITSKDAATPQADQQFYDQLKGPKDIAWMEGGQLDFYYKPEQVDPAVERVAQHFDTYLKDGASAQGNEK